jgi:hypothetical protein
VEVLGGVLVFGGVAAADVSALEAGAEMDPGVAQGDALLADMDFGWFVVAVGEMLAERHGRILLKGNFTRSIDITELAILRTGDQRGAAAGVVWEVPSVVRGKLGTAGL